MIMIFGNFFLSKTSLVDLKVQSIRVKKKLTLNSCSVSQISHILTLHTIIVHEFKNFDFLFDFCGQVISLADSQELG